MTYTASIGPISEGTLRPQDLLETFADELERLNNASSVRHGDETIMVREARMVDPETPEATDVLGELQDMLQGHAPLYTHFGTLDGDGACFGYWPDWEQMEGDERDGELVRIDDPSELEEHEGTSCLHVNDHGNVTLYGADGRVIWDCV